MPDQTPTNQDYIAYIEATNVETYRKAGNLNLFMMCESPNRAAFRELPPRYSFRLCRQDEIETWKRVAVEQPYIDSVTDYFAQVYARRADEFFDRCLFVCNSNAEPVSTCCLWRAYGLVETIGWFRTLPAYEGLGIGRALLGRLLEDAEFPVYLHTQPTSARAIKLYSDFGFRLLTDPVIGFRENHLTESLPILKKVMPEKDYATLQTVAAPQSFLEAVKTSEVAEF